MIESFDVFLTLAFIVPGFLIDWLVRKIIPKKSETDKQNLLTCFTLSFLNYGLWSWLIYILIKNNYYSEHPVLAGFIWFGIVFVSPMIIAIVAVLLYKYKASKCIAVFLGLNAIHPIPTSWDYKFSNVNQKKWVVVVLDDNREVAGVWGEKSFASSQAGERDIYLEEVYSIEADGTWKMVDRTDGMYINGDRIKLIQFWSNS